MDETVLKKRLQAFLGEMQKLGTVRGFKYFWMYLRGREEMIVSIHNSLQTSICNSDPNSPRPVDVTPSSSFDSHNLPYDKSSIMISRRSQTALSGLTDRTIGLPPASPSDEETQARDSSSTVFLLAGYNRYSCPYVWVRSNHERLVRLIGSEAKEKDSPLRLKSTTAWKNDPDMFIGLIIAELVKLCTYPAPRNPFEVDMSYFSSLPLQEQVLATAAMISFLQKLLLQTPEDKPYAAKALEDLQLVAKCHFRAMQELAKQGELPVLQKNIQQRKSSNSQSKISSRQRYPSTDSQYSSQQYTQYKQSAPQYVGYT